MRISGLFCPEIFSEGPVKTRAFSHGMSPAAASCMPGAYWSPSSISPMMLLIALICMEPFMAST